MAYTVESKARLLRLLFAFLFGELEVLSPSKISPFALLKVLYHDLPVQ